MNIIYGRIGRSSNMGATVDGNGCGLRVWAPNARKVALVAGEDLRAAAAQGWQPPYTTELEALGDGSWGGFAPGLGDGMPYMFHVQGNGSSGLKRDPFARDLTRHPPSRRLLSRTGSCAVSVARFRMAGSDHLPTSRRHLACTGCEWSRRTEDTRPSAVPCRQASK